jgi:two-component system phosphate regulon sensor histidine kinase PhoR
VIRLAMDLAARDAVIAEFHRKLLVAGGVGLCAALGFSFILSWLTLRPLREMRRVAASIAGGDLGSRLSLRPIEELGGISTAINEMADQIRQRIDELTHEKEQLQAVLNGMVEGVLVLDSAGRVLLANARMRAFYDIKGDVAGRSPLEVVRDAEVDDLLAEAVRTDVQVSRRVVRVGSDGRTFRVHAVRFPANGGPRIGTVAVFHDITEVARLELVRRDFVANASHELRTPVSAIRGFAETLLRSEDLSEGDHRSYLEIIDRHATRLGNLVSDLLELSKIEASKSESEPELVDVALVAESLVRDSRELFEARGLEIVSDVSPPAVVWARQKDVEQIVTNLLGNAANYTDSGGRIEITVSTDSDVVRLVVADSGIGIPRSDQDRIFERFYRVDASRSRAVGGTGLGLSIVKHLVLNMAGEISVSSEPGRGSTFEVTLRAADSSSA